MSWISVKDRLPSAGEYTLTYQKPQYDDDLGTPFGVNQFVGKFDDGTPVWDNQESQCVIPTHWMPTPEPPGADE